MSEELAGSATVRGAAPAEEPRIGVYVHLPFCSARCTYCDFAIVVGADEKIGVYLEALEREIALSAARLPARADTLYLGGGTPGRLSPEAIAHLVRVVRRWVGLSPGAEITLEANPENVDARMLEGWRQAGVTRLSVGVQSLDPGVLQRTGRGYSPQAALQALRRAAEAGFASLGADLILGLPGEPVGRWTETVERVVATGLDHLSLYLLETDKDAPLTRAVREGRLAAPADDALADAYEASVRVLERYGLAPYEIASFAREGHRSRHNLKYWTDQPYAGFGLGAHAYLAGERRANVGSLERYLGALARGAEPVAWREPPEPERRAREALMLGLRLVEGVDVEALERRWGVGLREPLAAVWERARAAGLIRWEGTRVRMPPEAFLRSSELFVELL